MKLINDDCLVALKNMESKSIDCIITDPPYGITSCKWDTVLDLDALWYELKRVIKPNKATILMAGQPFTSRLIMSNPIDFKYSWVWEKEQGTNFPMAKKQPLKVHEDICVFYAKQCLYKPQGLKDCCIEKGGKNKFRKDNLFSGNGLGLTKKYIQKKTGYPRSIQKFNRETGLHPTQKPVKLMEYLISTYTNKHETILDFTMGSGTTGVACVNTNRDFIGIELDDKYFQMAKDRIEAVQVEKKN